MKLSDLSPKAQSYFHEVKPEIHKYSQEIDEILSGVDLTICQMALIFELSHIASQFIKALPEEVQQKYFDSMFKAIKSTSLRFIEVENENDT